MKHINIILLAAFVIASSALPAAAQEKAANVEPVATPTAPVKTRNVKAVGTGVKSEASNDKKASKEETPRVFFAPTTPRDPFLSKEEVASIEKARLAEQKRIEDERKRLEEIEKKRLAELERQRQYEEELKRNPARAIIDKISIDGILGTEAIVNGEVVGVGGTILGAKIVKISDDSVAFVYKGQRFVKKLPLM